MSRPCVTPVRACPATTTTESTTTAATTDSVVESTPSPARATRDEDDDEDALDDDSSPLLGRLARVTLSDATNDATRAIGGVNREKPTVGGFGVKKRCANERRGVAKTIQLSEPEPRRVEPRETTDDGCPSSTIDSQVSQSHGLDDESRVEIRRAKGAPPRGHVGR